MQHGYYVYGDKGYPHRPALQIPYTGAHINKEQIEL
jgi:hypothetical protein